MIKRTICYLALCAVQLVFVGCAQYKLFSDGRSDYSIVVANDAPESEQYAAAELQNWIEQVSGAKLPVVDVNSGTKGKRLIVGYNPLTTKLVPSATKPADRDDSFTWKSVGGDVVFWGGSKRGTLYSVYSFLEKELGCRWFSSKVSVAPKRSEWNFKKLYNHEEPGIIIRDNCVLDVRVNPVFSARMRNNFIRVPSREEGKTVEGSAEGYWGVHAMGYFISPKDYYATHPEYFSLIDGKRQSDYAQLCLSNPDVLKICIEKLKGVMRSQPDYLIYSMEQNDNFKYCTCDKCQALVDKYGGQSGIMVWFVNQVADAVKDEFPDKFVGTFAYQYTRHAPKDIKPRENVVIRLCSIECCLMHDYNDCESNTPFMQDMKDWAAIAPHLYIWDYVTDFCLYSLPVPNWKTLQSHIRDFRDSHAIGILEEGDYQTTTCEFREMRSYLLSKLMWNPEANVDSLIVDFSDGYYGAAGKKIREYLDVEDKYLCREGMHTGCFAYTSHSMYSPEFLREGFRVLEEAKAAVADNPELMARVEKEELGLCILQMERYPIDGMKNNADMLFKKIVEREGISKLTEFRNEITAEYYMNYFAKLRHDMENSPLMPATEAKTKGNGVAFVKYEGNFVSTKEMVSSGKITEKGIKPYFTIDEEKEKDHFGYVFDTWAKVDTEGIHQIELTSDDGAVLLIDGKEIISRDGTHGTEVASAFVNLAEGLHRVTLRYFEDYDGQELGVKVTDPDGNYGAIPEGNLFVPAE